MGDYTEIFVNADLKENTPTEVIETLRAICTGDHKSEYLENKPGRWSMLFNNGSYYTPLTHCGELSFDDIAGYYSIIGKGDIKNYEGEIEKFFDFIKPWCKADTFIGYVRCEYAREPTLIYA